VDEIPSELLQSMGDVGSRRLFDLASKIYESGEIPSDFENFALAKRKREQTNARTTGQ
jgi:hypothetical protein